MTTPSKRGGARSCGCGGKVRFKRRCGREVLTALGPVGLSRSHGHCAACPEPGFAADGVLGLEGRLTANASRMACLAGLHDPFRKASRLLGELCGWSCDAEAIRRLCHQEAKQARAERGDRRRLPEQFAKAQGDQESHIDAGKVNTPDGWRDVKVAVFGKRKRAEPASSADYEQRDLPAPEARSVLAEVEGVESFGPRCLAEATRLGVVVLAGLTVLGDGAGWIWNLTTERFASAAQVLDVYHAVEHLASAGRRAFGDGPGLSGWLEGGRRLPVGDGYLEVVEALARPVGDDETRRRLDEAAEALNYFCGHRDRLGYAARLARGQAIGSGLVEGTIKQRVNVRMKRTGARWRPEHVGPFVELMAMADTAEWGEYWAMAI